MGYKLRVLRVTSMVAALSMMLSAAAPAMAAVTTLLSPQPDARVSGRNVEVAVGYNTQSDLKVTRLEFYVDGVRDASKQLIDPVSRGVSSFWWDPSKSSSGLHNIAVKIFAGDKLIGTARGTATTDKTQYDLNPPVVRLSNIKPGQVLSGNATLKIESKDDASAPVVSLSVDNSLKMLSNSKPCSYTLDTTQFPDGDHEIRLMAFDSSGNKTDAGVIRVTIKNNAQMASVPLPTPEAQPSKVAASEDDYAPAIPSVEPARPHITSSAARTEPEKRTLSAAPSGQIASKPAPQKRMVVATAPKSAALPKVKAPAPKPAAPMVMASLPTPIVPEVSSTIKLPALKMLPASEFKLPPIDLIVPDSLPKVTQPKASPVAPKPQAPEAVKATLPELPVAQPNAAPSVRIPGPRIPVSAPRMEPVPSSKPAAAAPVGLGKPIVMAMRFSAEQISSKPAVGRPTVIAKDTNAKLEKRLMVASGKVKLRDLVQDMGGILFWDSQSRMVTACLPGMKLEMEIGSQLLKVNGVEMGVDNAPEVLNGRTVIDADIYHLARQIAESGNHLAMNP